LNAQLSNLERRQSPSPARLALSTSFELDFWGHLRRISESAQAQVLASRYAKGLLALTLAGTTTQAYFALRSLDSQIAVTTVTLASRDEALAVVMNRAKGASPRILDVSQADARVPIRHSIARTATTACTDRTPTGHLTGKLDLKIPAGDLLLLTLSAASLKATPAIHLDKCRGAWKPHWYSCALAHGNDVRQDRSTVPSTAASPPLCQITLYFSG